MASLDPYTQIITYIWGTLEADANFAALVPEGNRVKLIDVETLAEVPMNLRPTSFPAVEVVPTGERWGENRSSDGISASLQFSIRLYTGEEKVDTTTAIGALKWAVVKALYSWIRSPTSFTHDPLGDPFSILRVDVEDVGDSRNENTRGPDGRGYWVGIMTLTVTIMIPFTSLTS